MSATDLRIVVAKRSSTAVPFGNGGVISAVTGDLTEGPALSTNDGGKTLFYHRYDSTAAKYKIYKVTRP